MSSIAISRPPRLHFRPEGCPAGVEPVKWRKAVRQRIDMHLDAAAALVSALDGVDVDADLEPTLGAPETFVRPGGFGGGTSEGSQVHWADGHGDGEAENADAEDAGGGDIQDQPHDGMDEDGSEPSLGWPESIRHPFALSDARHGDSEHNGNFGPKTECYADVFGQERNWPR